MTEKEWQLLPVRLPAELALAFLEKCPSTKVGEFLNGYKALIDLNRKINGVPEGWNNTLAELAAIGDEINKIHETPSKEQTLLQKERLQSLRVECVAIHYKRINLCQRK